MTLLKISSFCVRVATYLRAIETTPIYASLPRLRHTKLHYLCGIIDVEDLLFIPIADPCYVKLLKGFITTAVSQEN
jgi:hypothetical protein